MQWNAPAGKHPPEDAGKHIIGMIKLIARRVQRMQHFGKIKRTSSTVRSTGGKFMSRTNGSHRAFAQIFWASYTARPYSFWIPPLQHSLLQIKQIWHWLWVAARLCLLSGIFWCAFLVIGVELRNHNDKLQDSFSKSLTEMSGIKSCLPAPALVALVASYRSGALVPAAVGLCSWYAITLRGFFKAHTWTHREWERNEQKKCWTEKECAAWAKMVWAKRLELSHPVLSDCINSYLHTLAILCTMHMECSTWPRHAAARMVQSTRRKALHCVQDTCLKLRKAFKTRAQDTGLGKCVETCC